MNRNYEELSSYLSMEENRNVMLWLKLSVRIKTAPRFLEIQKGSLD